MAFNGSGTFNLASGNPVVSGTTISSTWANNTLTDIASGLTNTITRDGQSPATANIPLGNYKLTGVGAPTLSGDALVFGQNASIAILKLLGSTSGYVGLKGAAAAGSTTFTLPSADGSVGQVLLTDGAGNLSFGSAKFPSGTVMLFVQTAAPTGWTKSTTHNDKALRVVSGTASSGGTYTFSSTFANGNAGATTLSLSQTPGHYHGLPSHTSALPFGAGRAGLGNTSGSNGAIVQSYANAPDDYYRTVNTNGYQSTETQGSGSSHTHSLSLAVAYVDVIIATKD